jgi:hypothetical protein
MPKPRSRMGDKIRLSRAGRAAANLPRQVKRKIAVGEAGVAKQNARRKAVRKAGGNLAKDAVRRVGEYKSGKVSSEADYHSKEGKAKYKK